MAKKDLAYVKKRLSRIKYYLFESYALSRPVKAADELLQGIEQTPAIRERIDYYCKLDHTYVCPPSATTVGGFKRGKSFAYYADAKRILRHFDQALPFNCLFGDVCYVPDEPTFLKSRPIEGDNRNSVLLKLNAIRHYQFYEDKLPFQQKKPQAVWRGMVYHEHRRTFVDQFYRSQLMNVGHSDAKLASEPSYKGFMSIQEQMGYRYIVSIEGKDVATNLKWAMASNSLVMMRKPRFETWFMEGTLLPGVHYVELKEDFSDLEEKVAYYNREENVEEAMAIIATANHYVEQFKDPIMEHRIALWVAQKYFQLQKSAS